MATTRHLLNLSRRSYNSSKILTLFARSFSSSSSPATVPDSSTLPSPPPPTAMIYDRLAEQVKSKLKRLENPDSRFLQYTSPHPTITDHTPILSLPETRVTTLPNGLRIATESQPWSKTATVGVWIDTGSRFETDETSGVGHFLQSMVFEGTERRRTRKVINQEIESMGGHLNAYNTREMSMYIAKVASECVPKALDILADILQNSVFDQTCIDFERKTILEELEQAAGETKDVVFDHLHATAFQYTSLGRPIRGNADSIKTISQKELQDYISTHYAAHRMVISAAGAVKHEDIVEQVKKLFTKLSANPITTSQLVANEPAIFTGSEVRAVDDYVPLAQFAVAFNGASWTDPDSIALLVIQEMLGSWDKKAGEGKNMGPELAQRVAINELAESITSFTNCYKDTGLFGVYAVAEPSCLDDLAYVIMLEISKLCYRVAEADVIRARNKLKSSLLLSFDGTTPAAEDIGRQLITYGRRISVAEFFARIDAVDVSTIKRVANRFIFDQDLAIAAVGPIKYLPDYNWFRRRTYMLRY